MKNRLQHRRKHRALLTAAAAVVLTGTAVLATPAPAGALAEPGSLTVVANGAVDPYEAAPGSDGAVWFRHTGESIGRAAPNGSTTFVSAPGASGGGGITKGPDGNIWYASPGAHLVGRVTPAGVVTTFAVAGSPTEIAAGPDGNLWVTDPDNASISSITTTGTVTPHTDAALDHPGAITSDGTGALWFANKTAPGGAAAGVGRITTAGVVTVYPVTDAQVIGLIVGPDANVWFTTGTSVGRLTPTGTETLFPAETMPPADYPGDTRGITVGSDGAIWVMNAKSYYLFEGWKPLGVPGFVTRYDTTGAVLGTLTGPRDPRAATAGPDGNVWFVDQNPVYVTPGVLSTILVAMTPAGTIAATTSEGLHAPLRVIPDHQGGALVEDDQRGGNYGSTLRHVHADGTVTSLGAYVRDFSVGPDGTVWFTQFVGSGNQPAIVHVTPDGTVTSFPRTAPAWPRPVTVDAHGDALVINAQSVLKIGAAGTPSTLGTMPGDATIAWNDLTLAPDGSVWMRGTKYNGGYQYFFGRMTDAGVFTKFDGMLASGPMATDAADNLWFANGTQVGKITPDGVLSTFSDPAVQPAQIAIDPDGRAWVTDVASDKVFQVEPTGPFTPIITLPGHPAGLAGTPGGPVWVTVSNRSIVGTIAVIPDPGFSDVPPGAPFHDDIAWLVNEGIATGFGDHTFHPSDPVSRQAMAAFLYRRAGSPNGPDPICAEAPFLDVPIDAPFCGEIAWLVGEGIANGYGDETFHPTAAVSRQAMAAFLFRSAGSPAAAPACDAAPFDDVPVGAPFCREIRWLADQGIATGSEGLFRPLDPVSRQAIAAFLHRMATVLD